MRPEDDLQSLVKCFFYLSHPVLVGDMATVEVHNYAAIRGKWQEWLAGRSVWEEIMTDAASGEYADVKRGLERALQ